ncbi:MAG: winged helix-turn-helix domain-containing protein [Blastocatellia bacterium]|nr:winged helix-turn-helix domain-containing protein [Blastocatellia bacterium]
MNTRLEVGDWSVDRDLNTISNGAREVRLEPKIMNVLLLLAEEAGTVVSKERLMKAVWPDAFVTEQVLINAIWELRKALGDDARMPSYIQTVPRKGYRLIAQVSAVTDLSPGEMTASPGDKAALEKRVSLHKWRWAAAGLAMMLLISFAALIILRPGLLTGRTDEQAVAHKEARNAYAKGIERFDLRSPAAARKSLKYFEEAIALDPLYAQAHAALAANYILLVPKVIAPHDGYPKAKAAALKAMELDPRLAEAHSSMAMIKLIFDRDWAGAEREFQQALRITPENGLARTWYAQYLLAANRLDEATEQVKIACELEPHSIGAQATAGEIFWWTERYDEAMQAYRKILELDPDNISARYGVGNVYRKRSLPAQASAEYRKALEMVGEPSAATLAHTFAYAKKREPSLLVSKLDLALKQEHVPPSQLARIFASFNERDKAFYWLEKGYAEWDTGLLFLKSDDSWDSLREDPRFALLLRRVGFTD